MKETLKIKIANLAAWIMIVMVGLVVLWFIGFIVTNTFNLNIFTSGTTDFFLSLISFAFVLVACAAILNISLNISLIADSKIKELKHDKTKLFLNQRFFYLCAVVIAALIAFLFLGDYLSRQNEKNKLVTEAKDIIERYNQSIDELTLYFQDTAQIDKVTEILQFLSNQKSEFPMVTLLISDQYKNEIVYLQLNSFTSKEALKEPYFGYSFYKCNKEECDYLSKVFTGESDESYLWAEKNDYKFFYPIERNGQRMILLFTKFERYGSIGSY